jgi:hypothetical protein
LILIFHFNFLFLGVFNQLLFQTSPPNFFFLLISFSNLSLQHLQFSLISLLLFSFFNFCLAIYLAPPCFPIHASPMQEEMGIGKLSIFKPYLSLLLCGVQFLEGLVFVCVCVCFWVLFLCKFEIFNFFCVASFFFPSTN